uniref:Post-GPI attachment to proteins factor 3 n=1 Tax=Glossina palpalis gambiensis TaxID=67801 RepID=A0A1B0AM49_9MUSC
MLDRKSMLLRGFISLDILSYYINNFAYLSARKFSYFSNMVAQVVFWKYRPYDRKIKNFFLLMGLSTSLEFLNFRPSLWIFDTHNLWHLQPPSLSHHIE